MSKVMLVEDDNNLREIYEARLAAEGYEIVAAQDGEEALALAVKERPDLIIADIMMPKVSGFDMLDILRSTPETKHAKIIMMTALSQAEDKTRAEKLGADRYLVKSQVTLEDVVKVASEMLSETQTTPESAPTPDATAAPAADTPSSTPAPTVPTTPTVATSVPVAEEPTAAPSEPVADDSSAVVTPTSVPVVDDTASSDPGVSGTATDDSKPAEDEAAKLGDTTANEKAAVTEQIDDFISSNPTLSSSPDPEKEKKDEEESPVAGDETQPSDPATAPAVAETPKPEAPKATSITVKTADDSAITEETIPAPTADKVDDSNENAADKTLATAVDSLVGENKDTEDKPAGTPTPEPTDEKQKAETESDKPQLAKKRGGERVITPLSDPADNVPDLQALLAKEEAHDGLETPAVNSVITPAGTVQSSAPAAESSSQPSNDLQPGGTVAPAPPDDSETPKPDSPNNIAL
jgi:CheY-like chemotaxis protein